MLIPAWHPPPHRPRRYWCGEKPREAPRRGRATPRHHRHLPCGARRPGRCPGLIRKPHPPHPATAVRTTRPDQTVTVRLSQWRPAAGSRPSGQYGCSSDSWIIRRRRAQAFQWQDDETSLREGFGRLDEGRGPETPAAPGPGAWRSSPDIVTAPPGGGTSEDPGNNHRAKISVDVTGLWGPRNTRTTDVSAQRETS